MSMPKLFPSATEGVVPDVPVPLSVRVKTELAVVVTVPTFREAEPLAEVYPLFVQIWLAPRVVAPMFTCPIAEVPLPLTMMPEPPTLKPLPMLSAPVFVAPSPTVIPAMLVVTALGLVKDVALKSTVSVVRLLAGAPLGDQFVALPQVALPVLSQVFSTA